MMELRDEELVRLLEARDGPLGQRYLPHSAAGACRYAELYADGRCPWCEAEQRRRLREDGAGAGERPA